MNNRLKTREELVIEEVEREFEKENVVLTEQDKLIAKIAEYANPILDIFLTELLENSRNGKSGNMRFDRTAEEGKKAIMKLFSGK